MRDARDQILLRTSSGSRDFLDDKLGICCRGPAGNVLPRWTWNSWDYQQLMTERLATLDARVAAAATEDTLDDLEPAWASQIQCSICHRD